MRVRVRDDGAGELRAATRVEIEDDRVDKYLADPWDVPYVYRLRPCRQTGGARLVPEIYSAGYNGVDDTAAGREDGDDVRP